MEITATAVLTHERWTNASAYEKQQCITDLVQRLYAQHRSIQPRPPWCLVYVLPREQKIGSLFIPGKHHKVSLEGIVLATWNDWTEEKGFIENGVQKTRVVVHQSQLNRGDHVVFPHWSGLPLPGMDEKYFRIVKELGWSRNEEGGVFATIEHDEPYTTPQAKLRDIIEDALGWGLGKLSLEIKNMDELPGIVAAKIEQQFMLVDRTRSSVTISAFGKDV
jgi:co-chaperonin GroES (HSP10)